MRPFLYFFLFLFLSCRSQIGVDNAMQQKPISFEDKNHYSFTITSGNYFIINTQQKMDEVFRIIHQKNSGNRFSPIPAVVENETYIILKPALKNSNDVSIDSVSFYKNVLYVKVKEFENPDLSKTSRISPDILLKLNEKLDIKEVIIQY
ncbi:hypothetical protein [Chryseobacterium sp. MHB01]|uniref:hypothetical protein n=2 Tax=unclassified Chryseobacterium TaxID=2593645 RepID=UPI002AFFF836|nr:hypothetical protein [Chryseobacterium sp. MHB01]